MCPNSYFSQRNNQKLIRHSITYRVLDMDFIFHIVLQQRHQKKNVKTSIVKELNRKRPRHYRQKEVESIENHSVIILCLQIKQILVHTKSKLQNFERQRVRSCIRPFGPYTHAILKMLNEKLITGWPVTLLGYRELSVGTHKS